MNEPMRCLVVEDHARARVWLRDALHRAFEGALVSEAASVAQGRAAIAVGLPDLALLDLGLPDGSGLTLVRELAEHRRRAAANITIVVATVLHDDDNVFAAIRAGADGYLLKEETRDELVSMLLGIREQRPPLSPSIARRLLKHFHGEPDDDGLAPRERQVLQLLAKGFTVQRVADMLGITYHTASGYVKDIYRKLDVNTRAEATLEASRRGLV